MSILDTFRRELSQVTRTAVLRPEVFPYNVIEGLDP